MSAARRLAGLACVLLGLAACSKKSEPVAAGPKGGRCLYEAEGRCEEYKQSGFGMYEGICRGGGGVYSKDACGRGALLGSCMQEGDTTEFVYADNSINLLAEDAKARCEKGMIKGTWTADPSGAGRKTIELASPSKVRASCMYEAAEGHCTDFVTPDVMNMQRQGCEGRRGVMRGSACSREQLAGSCAQGGGRLEHYYAAHVSAAALALYKTQCETEMMGQRGHWVVGSAPPMGSVPAGSGAPAAPVGGVPSSGSSAAGSAPAKPRATAPAAARPASGPGAGDVY